MSWVGYCIDHVDSVFSVISDIICMEKAPWIYVRPTTLWSIHLHAVTMIITQQALYIGPMLTYCWATVCDAGPALNKHWNSVSCLPAHPGPYSDVLRHWRFQTSYSHYQLCPQTSSYIPLYITYLYCPIAHTSARTAQCLVNVYLFIYLFNPHYMRKYI